MERGDLETSLGMVNSDSVTAESSASFWRFFAAYADATKIYV